MQSVYGNPDYADGCIDRRPMGQFVPGDSNHSGLSCGLVQVSCQKDTEIKSGMKGDAADESRV
jgi:hypothetical protein